MTKPGLVRVYERAALQIVHDWARRTHSIGDNWTSVQVESWLHRQLDDLRSGRTSELPTVTGAKLVMSRDSQTRTQHLTVYGYAQDGSDVAALGIAPGDVIA